MDSLLGSYDSDDEGDAPAAKAAKPAPPANAPAVASQQASAPAPAATAREEATAARHGAKCSCEDCTTLLQRFVAKSVQTKGIRFKCRLCGDTMTSKATAAAHFQRDAGGVGGHAAELQAFKRQKSPALFEVVQRSAFKANSTPKISFARDDILRKRPADEDKSFGGWTKKEKPELPPCQRPEYQDEMQQPILTAPPWANAQRPSDEGASQMDKEVDDHIAKAQVVRFSKRNVLEINPTSVRCKLCFKIIGTLPETEKHVMEEHRDDFEREMQIWERFLYTTCKRQPPFGWVCKVCNTFFPSDGAVWRHIGKEVFIRREERHLTQWHEKEDRWGHEEDEECCGDGMNSRGMSYESVKRFHEQAKREEALEAARQAESIAGGPSKESDEEEEEEQAKAAEEAPEELGKVKFIQEF